MISAKPMAMGAMLALVGAAVAQGQGDRQRTLPRAIELLEDLPGHELQDRARNLISKLWALDASLRTQQRFAESIRRQAENEVRGAWHQFLNALAFDYTRIRHGEGSASIPMLQLLLLSVVTCANSDDAVILQVLSKEQCSNLADALLLAAKTPQEGLLGHIYMLHEGDKNARIRHALILGQMRGWATVVVPHLIKELVDEDNRLVQEIITSLGTIGPAAKDAIPTLETLTEHPDPQIAERAKAALRQVRGRSHALPSLDAVECAFGKRT